MTVSWKILSLCHIGHINNSFFNVHMHILIIFKLLYFKKIKKKCPVHNKVNKLKVLLLFHINSCTVSHILGLYEYIIILIKD